MEPRIGMAGKLASAFINSKLTPLLIVGSLLLGLFAVMQTPREEEPQIVVPMMDVLVSMPGATAKEVERRVTAPMEKLIWEIPGVEYLYSTSSPGRSMVVVRYYVGQDQEASLVKLREKLQSHYDLIPPGASQPTIKPRSIDDVPVLALTLHGGGYDVGRLRQIALRVEDAIKQVRDVSETLVIGGRRRELNVEVDPARMAGYGQTWQSVANALQSANTQSQAGQFAGGNQETAARVGGLLSDPARVGDVVVGHAGDRQVTVRDIARVTDRPEEATNYVFFGVQGSAPEPAVTISVAKRRGTNAIDVVGRALAKVESLKGAVIPSDVSVSVTRNYGATSSEKANDLLLHMMIAVVSVSILIAIALGKRESLVVLIAIPVTLALTLLIFYLYGYTLNRITLFALIFSIGILVDDAIVVVENIVRHYRNPESKDRSPLQTAIHAVDEVGNPTILATLAVIAAILPMAFVGGLMGPYMRPIPVGASGAMIFSLLVAFIVTPFAAIRLLKGEFHRGGAEHSEKEDWTARVYRRMMTPLLRSWKTRTLFFGGIAVLLGAAMALVVLKIVTVKMLPFDNKSEFQVIVDMPTGTTLEKTAAATRAVAEVIADAPDVKDYQMYVGAASPYNFNGLVRHYFMRSGTYQADIQVNLLPKEERTLQSHDIVKRLRSEVERVARRWGIRVKLAEVPPGPPVLQTLVAEVYGPDPETRLEVARKVKGVFQSTEGVSDVDWYVDDDQPTLQFEVDKAKAALSGVDQTSINRALTGALSGETIGLAHDESAREDVPIRLTIPRERRSSPTALAGLYVPGAGGPVPVMELVRVANVPADKAIYHKNLMPVVYVTGDVVGRQESPVYAILKMNQALDRTKFPNGYGVEIMSTHLPFTTDKPAMKWDGEWHITYEVFRDLGAAFAAVLILIYVLVVAWFQSFKTPLVIMAPIPLTLVGILPGHALLGAFFTATSMIGFIAGAGIIVRNSIILVDFIELRLRQGMPLEQAVIDAGATRFRPMLLTAAAVIVGSFVILFDPIFQGLAISLMAGEIASTLLSRVTVPVLYFLMKSREARPAVGGVA